MAASSTVDADDDDGDDEDDCRRGRLPTTIMTKMTTTTVTITIETNEVKANGKKYVHSYDNLYETSNSCMAYDCVDFFFLSSSSMCRRLCCRCSFVFIFIYLLLDSIII